MERKKFFGRKIFGELLKKARLTVNLILQVYAKVATVIDWMHTVIGSDQPTSTSYTQTSTTTTTTNSPPRTTTSEPYSTRKSLFFFLFSQIFYSMAY